MTEGSGGFYPVVIFWGMTMKKTSVLCFAARDGHLIISKGCTVQNVRKLCLYPRPPTWSHRRSGSTQSKKRKGDGVFTLDCPSQQEIVWCFLLSREVHVIHDPEHLVVISGIKSSGKNYDVGTKRTKERRRKTTQA
eukprot:scaffold1145_cov14-Tisochrysis_lutea.AAC.1